MTESNSLPTTQMPDAGVCVRCNNFTIFLTEGEGEICHICDLLIYKEGPDRGPSEDFKGECSPSIADVVTAVRLANATEDIHAAFLDGGMVDKPYENEAFANLMTHTLWWPRDDVFEFCQAIRKTFYLVMASVMLESAYLRTQEQEEESEEASSLSA